MRLRVYVREREKISIYIWGENVRSLVCGVVCFWAIKLSNMIYISALWKAPTLSSQRVVARYSYHVYLSHWFCSFIYLCFSCWGFYAAHYICSILLILCQIYKIAQFVNAVHIWASFRFIFFFYVSLIPKPLYLLFIYLVHAIIFKEKSHIFYKYFLEFSSRFSTYIYNYIKCMKNIIYVYVYVQRTITHPPAIWPIEGTCLVCI